MEKLQGRVILQLSDAFQHALRLHGRSPPLWPEQLGHLAVPKPAGYGWDGERAGKRVGVGRESSARGIAACALGRSAEPGLRGSCRQNPHVTV